MVTSTLPPILEELKESGIDPVAPNAGNCVGLTEEEKVEERGMEEDWLPPVMVLTPLSS